MRSIEAAASALHEAVLTLARKRPFRDPLATSCDALGLGPAQLHALVWVGHDGPLTMGALARRVGVTEKTATGIVDRLERDGFLQRARDDADRRVVHVRLTPRGAASSRRIEKVVHESLVRLVAVLDADEREALLRILRTLVERLGDPRRTRWRRPRAGSTFRDGARRPRRPAVQAPEPRGGHHT